MPAALETSKRKFHKLLDSLTGASSGDRPGTPGSVLDGGSTVKRPRLTPRSRLATSHPLVNSSTNLHAIRKVPSASVGGAVKETAARIPNFAPWSREHFQTRLKTFSNVTWWGSKPAPINEVSWSKRGWSCDGKNRVACKGGCEERIVVSLRPKAKGLDGKEIDGSEDFSVEISKDLVRRYELLIVEGHKEDCLWRGAGCADDIMRMPLARPSIWQPGLKERYDSFQMISESLPSLSKINWPFDLATISGQLGTAFFDTPDSNFSSQSDPNSAALAFALIGWHAYKEPGRNSYPTSVCSECFRRIGLWLYTNRPSTSSSEYPTRITEASASIIQKPIDAAINIETDDEDRLDLAESHKDYCPWINANSQATPGPLSGMAGYEMLAKVISNWASLRDRAMRTQERQALVSPTMSSDGNPICEDDFNEEEAGMTQAELTASREEVRRQDNARFARLRELSRMIGLKSFKDRFGKENLTQ